MVPLFAWSLCFVYITFNKGLNAFSGKDNVFGFLELSVPFLMAVTTYFNAFFKSFSGCAAFLNLSNEIQAFFSRYVVRHFPHNADQWLGSTISYDDGEMQLNC